MNLKEIEKSYNEVLEALNQEIITQIKKHGGIQKSSKKIGSQPTMLNYATLTDSFKTKIKILKRLDALKENKK